MKRISERSAENNFAVLKRFGNVVNGISARSADKKYDVDAFWMRFEGKFDAKRRDFFAILSRC